MEIHFITLCGNYVIWVIMISTRSSLLYHQHKEEVIHFAQTKVECYPNISFWGAEGQETELGGFGIYGWEVRV